MIGEGATIIDIGAVSTRPGARLPDGKEELDRLLPAVSAIRNHFPGILLSVDTFRTDVAKAALENGALMINDIYAGRFDGKMVDLVIRHNVPYIMMHMQGTPDTMQINPQYKDIMQEIHDFFISRLALFPEGYRQVILDPGFGFGKKVEHNYKMLRNFTSFRSIGYPLVAGLSRKSMINRVLHIQPSLALNGTTILNTIALLNGANILRVHDVKEAVETIKLVAALEEN